MLRIIEKLTRKMRRYRVELRGVRPPQLIVRELKSCERSRPWPEGQVMTIHDEVNGNVYYEADVRAVDEVHAVERVGARVLLSVRENSG